jgi:hypothetical protein
MTCIIDVRVAWLNQSTENGVSGTPGNLCRYKSNACIQVYV